MKASNVYSSLMQCKVIERARVHGAGRSLGIDINESIQRVGEGFGMTDFINPKNSPDKSISKLVNGAWESITAFVALDCEHA